MRTRAFDWFNDQTLQPLYGIQVLNNGRWSHLAIDGKAALFATPDERDAKRAEVRKWPAAREAAQDLEGTP